jgi:integrase/recombinase XerD
VEYAVAVDHYLGGASLGAASRRIYRISLTSWAWPLVGKRPPQGTLRRGAAPPVLPLALLDDADVGARLAAAVADRATVTDTRTVNREISALRSAVGWWCDLHWLHQDPTAGLSHLAASPPALPPLTEGQVASLLAAPTGLREQAFWRLLYDTAARAEEVLGLDAGRLDLSGHRARIDAPPGARAAGARGGGAGAAGPRGGGAPGGGASGAAGGGGGWEALSWLRWRSDTSELLRWLLAGRPQGPVFLTDRRAPANVAAANVCPITGRARLSYRRAAEIFTASTRSLDPARRGWTLHQLRLAGLANRP